MTVKEMEKPVGLHLTPAFLLSDNRSSGKSGGSRTACVRHHAHIIRFRSKR
jgi:hypothetical protein